MPFIEPESGDVEHGVGGGNASINNRAFSPGGAGGWRDPDHAVFANGADAWIVSTFNKRTGEIRRVEFPVDEGAPTIAAAAPRALRAYSRTLARTLAAPAVVDVETAANVAYAGGGHVAAWLGSRGEDRGLYSTTGLRLKDAGLLGMGPDGALAYKPSYQSNGPTIVRELTGDEWQITPGHAAALQLLGARRGIWMEGFSVRVENLPTPQYHAGGGIWKAQAAYAGGQWWICYYSGEKGIVLHPFASSARAFPILPVGDGWHAIAPIGPNTIRIAISRTEGEGAGDIWGYDLDVTTGAAAPLPFWPGGVARVFPFLPIEEINPAPLPRPTFAFTHPISVYPFKAAGSGRPDVFTLGTYAEGRPPAPLPKGRLLLAHDSPADWTIPAGELRSYDLVLWELYRVKGETLAASAARWDRQARSYLQKWPRDCGVIPMFYCQGGVPGGNPPELWTVAEVLEGLEYLDAIANLSPRIKVVAPFAYDRANGIVAHPELRQAFDDLVAAAARAGESTLTPIPTDPPIDPPKPPNPFRTHTKGSAMSQEIDGKIVQLRGAGAFLISPDAPGTGLWKEIDGKPSQWRGVVYTVDAGDASKYRAKKLASGRYTFTNVAHNCLAGGDGGQYSTDPGRQGYHKPTGDTDAGDLEQFRVYDGNENGAIEAQIEQTTDANHPAGAGKKIFVFPLTVEIVA
jgi:hypothetical protein